MASLSPRKLPSTTEVLGHRLPTSITFNPLLPKTPNYPTGTRAPKRNESMLSINGSPLTNPYDIGVVPWEKTFESLATTNGPARGTLKRSKSSILVRRDPSISVLNPPRAMFTRTVSHHNVSAQTPTLEHESLHVFNAQAAALLKIPTTDGHVLEFDPLQTSPGQIDALEGITDSAKRQARQEVGRLVQAAVSKWKIC